MKKYLFLLVGILLITSCMEVKKENEVLTNRNDSLVAVLQKRNADLESALATISDIQTGFQKINDAEGRINVRDEDGELSRTPQAQLKNDLEFITETMEKNRQRIEELESQLKASGNKNASLQKIIKNLNNELSVKVEQIAKLQSELSKKNIRISELDSAVNTLTHDVNTLHEANVSQEKVIAEQEATLNRAWYVFGTSKELKEQNILKDGKVFSEDDFNRDYFTAIDIRTDLEFPLYAKKAELLTNHPKGSYYMKTDESNNITFVIIDPAQFWSVSRYMVIRVK
ncbi:MAG: hypothetical protein J5698_00210 [Bacteroidaceae bacterium]|nr:hypothetical protein [Bacteroidaceae bacterium]